MLKGLCKDNKPGKGSNKPEPKASLIQWAAHCLRSAIEHMSVNHGRFDIGVQYWQVQH